MQLMKYMMLLRDAEVNRNIHAYLAHFCTLKGYLKKSDQRTNADNFTVVTRASFMYIPGSNLDSHSVTEREISFIAPHFFCLKCLWY